MSDLDAVGGVQVWHGLAGVSVGHPAETSPQVIMKELLANGLLHGDVLTVTGNTVADNLAETKTLAELGGQKVVYSVAEPFAPAGTHITVLQGTLATQSALLKLGGKLMRKWEGPAQCYDGEQACRKAWTRGTLDRFRPVLTFVTLRQAAFEAIINGEIKKGSCLVCRGTDARHSWPLLGSSLSTIIGR
jgi:hypothetical protein